MKDREQLKFPVYIGKARDSIRMWLGQVNAADVSSFRLVKNALKKFHDDNKVDCAFVIHTDLMIDGSLTDVTYPVGGNYFTHCSCEFEFNIDKRMEKHCGISGYFYLSGEVEGHETEDGDNKLTKLELYSLYYHHEHNDTDELLLPNLPF